MEPPRKRRSDLMICSNARLRRAPQWSRLERGGVTGPLLPAEERIDAAMEPPRKRRSDGTDVLGTPGVVWAAMEPPRKRRSDISSPGNPHRAVTSRNGAASKEAE